MKPLGESLKEARMNRGIPLEQAVNETNISRNLIEALEAENFDQFPAEAYLIGFLRNYSDFLGLETEKIISQYKNFRLSEQVVPMEKLIGPAKRNRLRQFLPWIFLAFIVMAVLFLTLPRITEFAGAFRERRETEKALQAEMEKGNEITVKAPLWEGKVLPGDILKLESEDASLNLNISEMDNRLLVENEGGESWPMRLGEEIYIPDENGQSSWRIYMKDFGLSNGAAVLEVEKLTVNPRPDVESDIFEVESLSQSNNLKVILKAKQPTNYTVNIEVKEFTMLRYKIDRRNVQQSYLSSGDQSRLDVRRNLTLWVSDAGALSIKIKGEELSLGKAGEVVVYQIRWIIDETNGGYNLSAIPIA